MTAHRHEATKIDYPSGVNVAWSDRSPAQRARLIAGFSIAATVAAIGLMHISNSGDITPSNYPTVVDNDQQSDASPIGNEAAGR